MKSLKYDFFNSNNTRNFQVYNDTGSAIPAKRVVRATSFNTSNNAVEAETVSSLSHKPFGVTEVEIPAGSRGDVVVTGIVTGINTQLADVLDPVYLSETGELAFSGPLYAKIGFVIAIGAMGKVFINISGVSGDNSDKLIHNIYGIPDASLKKGMPVYWNGTEYLPALADDLNTVAVGIISEINDDNYIVQFGGMMNLSALEWNQITGSTGGLTPGSTYYLDHEIPGKIVITSPSISNPILTAISTTEAIVQLKVLSLPDGGGDSIIQETFLSSLNQTDFLLDYEPIGKSYTWLFLDGTLENNYDILSGTTIRLDNPLTAGVNVDVRYARYINLETRNQVYTFDETVVSGPKSSFTLPVTPTDANNIFVFVDGAIQIDSYSYVGPTLTFDTPISTGQRVYAKVMQSVNYDADINNYYKRKTAILTHNSSLDVDYLFEENVSGRYEIQVQSDPRIFMTARLKAGTGADFFTTSSSVSQVLGTGNSLNVVYDGSGGLLIQNKLGTTETIVITRQT